jgi:hypothetical protein
VLPLILAAFVTNASGRTLVISLAAVAMAHLWFESRSPQVRTPPQPE